MLEFSSMRNTSGQVFESIKKPALQTPKYEEPNGKVEEQVTGHKIYRDKAEVFVCDIQMTGANPTNSKARIILETSDLTYMFEGGIDPNGTCKVPLRKMNFLDENESGRIRLEVIAEDMVFTPWQDNFVAVNSKKVDVKIVESEDMTPRVGITVTNIR